MDPITTAVAGQAEGQPLAPEPTSTVEGGETEAAAAAGQSHRLSTVSGVLAIIALTAPSPYLLEGVGDRLDGGAPILLLFCAPVLGILAAVLGLIAVARNRTKARSSMAMAVVGVVGGPVATIVSVSLIAAWLNYLSLVMS